MLATILVLIKKEAGILPARTFFVIETPMSALKHIQPKSAETKGTDSTVSALPDVALRPDWHAISAPIIQALLRSTKQGILMTDHNKNDILCNPRFAELFDVEPELVVRLPSSEVRRMALVRVKDPEAFSVEIERIYADPEREQEDEIELSTTPPRFLHRSTGPVRDAQGNNVGRFWTFEDITEIKRLQAEVQNYALSLEDKVRQQAEKLQEAHEKLLETARMNAVGTLAVGIAHDIRNILASLQLELYAAGNAPGLLSFQAQLNRLMTLTHRLLALSNQEPIRPAPLDIGEMLKHLLDMMQAQTSVCSIVIHKQLPDKLPPVLGDARRLEYLFVNVFLNAMDAMNSGGTLHVAATAEENAVRVDIRDSGEGIAKSTLPHVFEAFYTTRANRSGLGLFSVRRIVEEHQGRVTVNSTPEQGTCVSVWLPKAPLEDFYTSD